MLSGQMAHFRQDRCLRPYQTVAETDETMALSKLETVYENGFLTKDYSFSEVRDQALI
jgi:hypothetical protein